VDLAPAGGAGHRCGAGGIDIACPRDGAGFVTAIDVRSTVVGPRPLPLIAREGLDDTHPRPEVAPAPAAVSARPLESCFSKDSIVHIADSMRHAEYSAAQTRWPVIASDWSSATISASAKWSPILPPKA